MPTLLTNAPEIPLPLTPPRKRWTREECAALEPSGLFERERLELIEGDLIGKMGENRPHVNAFTLMHLWLLEAFGKQFVNAQAPIEVGANDNPLNEPEPDLIVLKRESSDIVAGIVEYWVLDVAGRRLFVHRNPASGNYTAVTVYSENEAVAPLAATTAEFRPAQAFAGQNRPAMAGIGEYPQLSSNFCAIIEMIPSSIIVIY